MEPSSAVVSRISPGFGRGFFSFSGFFFFFFLVGVTLCICAVFIVVRVFKVAPKTFVLAATFRVFVLFIPFPFVA